MSSMTQCEVVSEVLEIIVCGSILESRNSVINCCTEFEHLNSVASLDWQLLHKEQRETMNLC